MNPDSELFAYELIEVPCERFHEAVLGSRD